MRTLALLGFVLYGASASATESTLAPKHNSLLLIPLVYYTPETSIAGGLGCVYFIYPQPNLSLHTPTPSKTSSILADAIYTANQQYQLEIKPDLYWNDERFHLVSRFNTAYYPDKFFGIGPATPAANEEHFTPFIVSCEATLYQKIAPNLQMGLQCEFESDAMRQIEPGKELAQGTVTGSQGGISLGFGAAANWDSRDDIFMPQSGDYTLLSLVRFDPLWGSDFAFTRLNLEWRHFANIWGSHVLALMTTASLIAGDPPFQKMARMGGLAFMRGLYTGRYRDRDLLGMQAEYRLPLFGRLSTTLFAGWAAVSHTLAALNIGQAEFSWGGGLRYRIDRDERLQLRADMGFAQGSAGFYLTVGEAF